MTGKFFYPYSAMVVISLRDASDVADAYMFYLVPLATELQLLHHTQTPNATAQLTLLPNLTHFPCYLSTTANSLLNADYIDHSYVLTFLFKQPLSRSSASPASLEPRYVAFQSVLAMLNATPVPNVSTLQYLQVPCSFQNSSKQQRPPLHSRQGCSTGHLLLSRYSCFECCECRRELRQWLWVYTTVGCW